MPAHFRRIVQSRVSRNLSAHWGCLGSGDSGTLVAGGGLGFSHSLLQWFCFWEFFLVVVVSVVDDFLEVFLLLTCRC